MPDVIYDDDAICQNPICKHRFLNHIPEAGGKCHCSATHEDIDPPRSRACQCTRFELPATQH
jgi:hypothetical protein